MSRADYYRLAWDQVHQIAWCASCGREVEYDAQQSTDGPCVCGGRMRLCGESYPASADDWNEE